MFLKALKRVAANKQLASFSFDEVQVAVFDLAEDDAFSRAASGGGLCRR